MMNKISWNTYLQRFPLRASLFLSRVRAGATLSQAGSSIMYGLQSSAHYHKTTIALIANISRL